MDVVFLVYRAFYHVCIENTTCLLFDPASIQNRFPFGYYSSRKNAALTRSRLDACDTTVKSGKTFTEHVQTNCSTKRFADLGKSLPESSEYT